MNTLRVQRLRRFPVPVISRRLSATVVHIGSFAIIHYRRHLWGGHASAPFDTCRARQISTMQKLMNLGAHYAPCPARSVKSPAVTVSMPSHSAKVRRTYTCI